MKSTNRDGSVIAYAGGTGKGVGLGWAIFLASCSRPTSVFSSGNGVWFGRLRDEVDRTSHGRLDDWFLTLSKDGG